MSINSNFGAVNPKYASKNIIFAHNFVRGDHSHNVSAHSTVDTYIIYLPLIIISHSIDSNTSQRLFYSQHVCWMARMAPYGAYTGKTVDKCQLECNHRYKRIVIDLFIVLDKYLSLSLFIVWNLLYIESHPIQTLPFISIEQINSKLVSIWPISSLWLWLCVGHNCKLLVSAVNHRFCRQFPIWIFVPIFVFHPKPAIFSKKLDEIRSVRIDAS